jgi:hypothetical protein
MDGRRRDFEKGDEDKIALGKPGVGNGQPSCGDHQILRDQDVDVDHPRPVPRGRSSPDFFFHRLDEVEEVGRLQVRTHLDNLIIEPGLSSVPHRLGAVERGGTDDPHSRLFQGGQGAVQIMPPVSKVGAEAQEISHRPPSR